MPIFAVDFDIEKKAEIEPFLEFTNDNLLAHDMIRNPFTGKVTVRDNTIIVDMNPLYPNPLWIGVVAIVPILIFNGLRFSWWLIIPTLFLLGAVPHTPWFVCKMFQKGAKRKGYTGSFKRVGRNDIIRRYI